MAKEMNKEALKVSIALLDKRAKMVNERAKADGSYAPWMEKLNEILADEAICKKLLAAESAAEARSVMAENGLEMTEEAVDALGEYVVSIGKRLLENGGELSEEELENVAGGVLTEATLSVSMVSAASSTSLFSSSIASGAAAGTAGFPVVGTIVGAAVAAAVTAGVIYRKEIMSGLEKVGSWIKSWF